MLRGAEAPVAADVRYEQRAEHDPDGIGKFFQGREIARVMGHEGAGWLERPERETEERTDLLLRVLGLKPGMKVADIGCGTGYFSGRMARAVAPDGVVFAVDIQQEMLDLMAAKLRREKVDNVRPVLGTEADPRLEPASCDLLVMVDVYHELEFPFEMMRKMVAALRPGGRLVLVEFRAEDPHVAIKPVHKMSEVQVKKEMAMQPDLEWVETRKELPRQHVLIFRRK